MDTNLNENVSQEIEKLSDIIRKGLATAETYYYLAANYRLINKQHLEEECYKKALELNPEYVEVYLERAKQELYRVLCNRGDYTKVLDDVKKVLDIDSNNIDAYIISATIKEKAFGDKNAALEDYAKVLEIDEKNEVALACVRLIQDDNDLERVKFQETLIIDSEKETECENDKKKFDIFSSFMLLLKLVSFVLVAMLSV